ncbi:hypothetical protein BH18ACT11_BH18ACT11_21310 [soil metagenome]
MTKDLQKMGGVDIVFGHVGGPRLVDSRRMLRRGGTLIIYGSASKLLGAGHWIMPYLPNFARVLLWNATLNGKPATRNERQGG